MFKTFLTFLVSLYQITVSPFLPPACRHYPTCSDYAKQAIVAHGSIRGIYLTTKRLLRCQPWGTSGFDPVPERISSSCQS